MASTSIISRHWEKQSNVFLKNFNELRLRLNGKAIHDLRVAVKKLRSYLVLYNQLTGPDEAGLQLSNTEILFNITGKYRDIEVSLDLLEFFKHTKTNHYLSLRVFLQNALHLNEDKTGTELNKFRSTELQLIGEVIRNRLSEEPKDEIAEKIKRVINQQLVDIIVLHGKKDKQPHELRKQLKNLYYWLFLFQKNTFLPASQIKKLDTVLNQLGLWQDHQILVTRTKHFRKDFIAKKTVEHSVYKKLEESLINKGEKLLSISNLKLSKLLEAIEKNKLLM